MVRRYGDIMNSMEAYVDLESQEVVAALPQMLAELSTDIEQIRLVRLRAASRMQARLADPSGADELITRSVELFSKMRIPFWDAVLLSLANEPPGVRRDVLKAAQFHQSVDQQESVQTVQVSNLTESSIKRQALDTPVGQLLALQSLVDLCDGESAHVPMLDFRVEPTDANLTLIEEVMGTLGMCGWICESGRSFHFYGDTLISSDGLSSFLGRSLLFMPLVDPRWVAHQLMEGQCSLRISRGGPFQVTPRIVRRLK